MSPLREARESYVFLDAGWRFRPDPKNRGLSEGWAQAGFDDSGWAHMETRRNWESQGHAGYDGVAWYRVAVFVPEAWRGSKIRFEVDGAGDEYDVFVQGRFVRHQGGGDFGSVSQWQTITDVEGALDYGRINHLVIRVTDLGWSAGGGLWRRTALRRVPPLENYRAQLPVPVLESHPEWLQLYWKTWELAWERLSFGDERNGFAPAFMEEAFNEQVYQWDSSFIALFARYAPSVFPAMDALDNFYGKQSEDGYIQRSYSIATGALAETPTNEEPAVNPPLFAWVEWRYYELTGDDSRLARVLPHIEALYGWMQAHLRTPFGQGLYFQTGLGSGMDNIPRGDAAQAGWVDASMQQALAARYLAEIAQHLGLSQKAAAWRAEHAWLSRLINEKLWSESESFYFDLQRDGSLGASRHLGALWALVAGVADEGQASRMVAQLADPAMFWRARVFPVLPASDPLYAPAGHYWRGGIWAPTNYMTIKGLEEYGHDDLAHAAAENYLATMASVYAAELPRERITALDRTDGPLHTLWECYAPERNEPCSSGNHGGNFVRGNFVGWTGVGPVSLLIENVIGLRILGARGDVAWNLRDMAETGLQDFQLGAGNRVSLVAERADAEGRWIRAEAARPYVLHLRAYGRLQTLRMPSGVTRLFVSARPN
jgi:hypothetical protein